MTPLYLVREAEEEEEEGNGEEYGYDGAKTQGNVIVLEG